MLSLKELLPPAKSSTPAAYDFSSDPWFKDRFDPASKPDSSTHVVKAKQIPPYGKRSGFVPRKPEDFGDGGAFPEIHVAQYPLDMGRREPKPDAKTLPVNVDAQGNVAYDAIVKQNENTSKIGYSQHKDLLPKLPGEGGGLEDVTSPSIDKAITRAKGAESSLVALARIDDSARITAGSSALEGCSKSPFLLPWKTRAEVALAEQTQIQTPLQGVPDPDPRPIPELDHVSSESSLDPGDLVVARVESR